MKKKVPMRESNPRPLNLQPPHNYRLGDFVARTIIIIPTYTANLNGDELRVASLAALAPPTIFTVTVSVQTLSGGLVMWDSIEPTQDWIDQQIPSVSHTP